MLQTVSVTPVPGAYVLHQGPKITRGNPTGPGAKQTTPISSPCSTIKSTPHAGRIRCPIPPPIVVVSLQTFFHLSGHLKRKNCTTLVRKHVDESKAAPCPRSEQAPRLTLICQPARASNRENLIIQTQSHRNAPRLHSRHAGRRRTGHWGTPHCVTDSNRKT